MSQQWRENPDFCKLALAADLLQSGVPIQSRCSGSSMIPALWPGDMLTIEPVNAKALLVGDIVVVAREQWLVTHRLIWHGNLGGAVYWITRGDSMQLTDSPITAQQIVGQVSGIERRGEALIAGLRLTLITRIVGWMIARSDLFRWLALRLCRTYQILGAQDPDRLTDQQSLPVIQGTID